jgi:hypothetical protein
MRPPLAAAQQGRNHGDTVEVLRFLGPAEFGGRGKKVPKGPDVRGEERRRSSLKAEGAATEDRETASTLRIAAREPTQGSGQRGLYELGSSAQSLLPFARKTQEGTPP